MTAVLEDVKSEVYDKWGSLITAIPSTKLPKEHSPRAQNVWTDEQPGALVTVEGSTKVGDLPSGNPCRFMYTFEKSDGTSMVLVSDNGTVYKTTDFTNFTSIITGLSTAFQLRAVTLRDKVWLTNGNDDVRTYDGSSVTVLDGTSSTPDVPHGRFIEVWHERIWLGDIPSNRSAVRFSALTDSSGVDITPDDADAWPADNEIHFGQDDGDVVCGLKVYLGVLHAFKAASIWRVVGEDEFTYGPFRTTATTGSRLQESIQERDNLLEFIGLDGVYEFDGNITRKVSTPIDSVELGQFSFRNIQQSGAVPKSKFWTSQSDFQAGTTTDADLERIPGSIVIADEYEYDASALPASSSPVWTKNVSGFLSGSSEGVAGGILTISATLTSSTFGGDGTLSYSRVETVTNANGAAMTMRTYLTAGDGLTSNVWMQIRNGTNSVYLKIFADKVVLIKKQTGIVESETFIVTTNDTYHIYRLEIINSIANVYMDGTLILTGTITQTSSDQRFLWGVGASIPGTTTADIDYVTWQDSTSNSAEFISDIYSISDTISTWGAFQASYDNNSGSVLFYIRGATTLGGVTGESWTLISPGSTIALATDRTHVQWRAVFSCTGTDTPQVDDVTINWNTSSGGFSTQLVATIVHNERYWISGASTDSLFNDILLVRGKRRYDAPWLLMDGFNFLAFCIFNNQLYAAASDSDDIYRLGGDSSINGAALDAYWETRDEVGGLDEDVSKRFPIIVITGQCTGSYNLTVDISIDGGITFPSAYQKEVSLSGSGPFKSELRYPTLRGRMCRVKVGINGINKPFEIHSIKMFWRSTQLR